MWNVILQVHKTRDLRPIDPLHVIVWDLTPLCLTSLLSTLKDIPNPEPSFSYFTTAGSLAFLRLICMSGLLYKFFGNKIQLKMFNFFQHHEASSFWVSWKEQSSNLDKRSEWAVRAGRTWGAKFQEGSKIYHSKLYLHCCILTWRICQFGE